MAFKAVGPVPTFNKAENRCGPSARQLDFRARQLVRNFITP
jgi:hypothetical protein